MRFNALFAAGIFALAACNTTAPETAVEAESDEALTEGAVEDGGAVVAIEEETAG